MTEAVGNIFYFNWEMHLMEWLQAHIGTSGFLFTILSNLSAFGEQLLLVVIMGFFYWGLSKEFGKYIGTNILVVNVWFPMIKNVAKRLRPYFVEEYNVKLLRLIDKDADMMDVAAQGYSFPSGHSTNSATIYGSLAAHEKNKKWLWALAFILPFLVGFSRVYVGAHFPTDVLCGWALGALIVFAIPRIRAKIENRWVFYAILLVLSLPGVFFCTTTDYFTGLGMLIGFLLAEPFEEKYVNFKNTSSIPRCILRTLGGAVIYFGLNEILKIPFPKDVLAASNFLAYFIRTARYAIVIFVDVGVYPMLFKKTAKIGKKNREDSGSDSAEDTDAPDSSIYAGGFGETMYRTAVRAHRPARTRRASRRRPAYADNEI